MAGDPVGPLQLHARPGPAAAAVDLAALDRERHIGASRIAGHKPHLGAEYVSEHDREDVGVGARALSRHRERDREAVAPGLHLRGVPRSADADLVGAAADPGEFARIEIGAARPDQRLHRHAAPEYAEHRAVLRGGVVNIIGGTQAAGARHVLDHDRWMARNVLAEMSSKYARAGVIPAADAVADNDGDRAAAIEAVDRL